VIIPFGAAMTAYYSIV